jgi:hypothetical protein
MLKNLPERIALRSSPAVIKPKKVPEIYHGKPE